MRRKHLHPSVKHSNLRSGSARRKSVSRHPYPVESNTSASMDAISVLHCLIAESSYFCAIKTRVFNYSMRAPLVER